MKWSQKTKSDENECDKKRSNDTDPKERSEKKQNNGEMGEGAIKALGANVHCCGKRN